MPDNDSSANNPQEPDHYFSAIPLSERKKIWERICRPVDNPTPVKNPTEFDRMFQTIVGPKLAPVIHFSAHLIGSGLESFSVASDRVMQAAIRWGALHLSEDALYALGEWIDHEILACIDAGPPEGVISVERLQEITGEPR